MSVTELPATGPVVVSTMLPVVGDAAVFKPPAPTVIVTRGGEHHLMRSRRALQRDVRRGVRGEDARGAHVAGRGDAAGVRLSEAAPLLFTSPLKANNRTED